MKRLAPILLVIATASCSTTWKQAAARPHTAVPLKADDVGIDFTKSMWKWTQRGEEPEVLFLQFLPDKTVMCEYEGGSIYHDVTWKFDGKILTINFTKGYSIDTFPLTGSTPGKLVGKSTTGGNHPCILERCSHRFLLPAPESK